MKSFIAIIFIFSVVLSGCDKAAILKEIIADPIPVTVELEHDEVTAEITLTVSDDGMEDMKLRILGPDAVSPVYFDYDAATLHRDDILRLGIAAEVFKRFPWFTLEIEGHCDSRGTAEYNQALGQRRADSVRDYLEIYGVKPERMHTISYGEEKPRCFGNIEECYKENRRVEFTVSGEYKEEIQ